MIERTTGRQGYPGAVRVETFVKGEVRTSLIDFHRVPSVLKRLRRDGTERSSSSSLSSLLLWNGRTKPLPLAGVNCNCLREAGATHCRSPGRKRKAPGLMPGDQSSWQESDTINALPRGALIPNGARLSDGWRHCFARAKNGQIRADRSIDSWRRLL